MSRIGIDIDGCLADFNTSFQALLKTVSGHNLIPPNYVPDTWHWMSSLGYTKDEISATWEAAKANRWFWYDLPPYEDTHLSLHYLATLAQAGHDLYFITSRPGVNAKVQTEGWLYRQFQGAQCKPIKIPVVTVLISSMKGLCARALALDAYIDDRWENCLECPPTCRTFLLDRCWNTAYNAPAFGITRVTSVVNFLDTPTLS